MVRRHVLAAQKALLLILTKACRTISTSAMQVISGILLLDLEIIRQGLVNKIKRNLNVSWNNYNFEKKEPINMEEEIELIKKEIHTKWQKKMDRR